MNHKKAIRFAFVMFFLLSFVSLINSQRAHSAPQWGWPTHHRIVTEAMEELNVHWQELFENHIQLVKSGAVIPDTWGDWDNHLYYPDQPDLHTGPQAIERWYNYFADNLSMGHYYDGIWAGAVMSHYWADLNIPVHTGPLWDGHSAYETDINRHIDEFVLKTITIDENITDIEAYAITAAEHANQYYDTIKTAYPDGNPNNKVINDANIREITEEQLTRSVAGLASIWIKGFGDALAPILISIPFGESTWKALLDKGHTNDYAVDGELANMANYLGQNGYEAVWDDDGITATDLEGINFLVFLLLKATSLLMN